MPTPVSLLCLPCAGASATMYLRWRRLLPRWVEVVPVELPGRGALFSEPFIEDFEALVSWLCRDQQQVLSGRYALFGHSMGALLAHGMALRQLEAGGPLPQALLVAGSPAPSRRDPTRFAGKQDEASLIADLREQGGTPEEVFANEELMRITLDVLAADYRVCASLSQVAHMPLPVPVHAFGGRQDDVGAERLEAWAAEAGGVFSVDWFEGGHFFIRDQEALLMQAIVKRLMSSAMATSEAWA